MKKYDCEKNDKQCHNLNKMLKKRKTIIVGESMYNNIFLHYIAGFLIIFTLLNIRFKKFNILYLLFGGFLGWIYIDMVSYFIHLFMHSDYYESLLNDEDKKSIIDTHHINTLNYSYLNNVELVMISYPIFLPTLFVLCVYHFIINKNALQSSFYVGFFICICLLGLMSGYFHKWAHERNHNLLDNSFITYLQDNNIILNGKEHEKHHIHNDGNDNFYYYSLVNGVSHMFIDPLLQKLEKP